MAGIDPPTPPAAGRVYAPAAPAAASATPAPAPRPRLTPPDLTGFYEHRPQKGKGAALTLQIDQAGRVVVGWFAAPPSFLPGNVVSPTVSRSARDNPTRMRPGVLVAFLPDSREFPPNGVKFDWRTTPGNAQPDPADPMAMYTLDPPDVFLGTRRAGFLRVVRSPFREIGLEIALCFEYDPTFPIHDLARYDRFLRVGMNARLPNDTIRTLHPDVQARILTEQVAPIAESHVELVKAKIAPLTDERPPAAALLEAWWRAGDPAVRRIAREKIGDHVQAALETNLVPGHYREALYGPVRAHADWKDFTIDGHVKSWLGWYRQVAAEEVDRLRELQGAAPATAPKWEDVPLLKAFRRAGFEPPGAYVYTFSFQEIAGSLADAVFARLEASVAPKIRIVPGIDPHPGSQLEQDVVREMRPGRAKSAGRDLQVLRQVLKLKGALFRMDVKKERAKLDAAGAPVLKDGKPEVDPSYAGRFDTAGTLASPSSFLTNGFVGIMGEIGAGLSFESSQGKFAVSGSLKKTSVVSSLDLGLADFAHAKVRGVLLGGPSAKFGDYLGLDVFTSRYFEVTLAEANGSFVLSTSETESLKVKKISPSDLKPKFKTNVQEMIDDFDKKWTRPQIEGRILELSGSWAWVLPLFEVKHGRPLPSERRPPGRQARRSESEGGILEAFFRVNRASLDEPTVGVTATASALQDYGLHGRDLLELFLATHRAFFTSPSASMVALGLASPEGRTEDNRVLSERRAHAVAAAVKDAFEAASKIAAERTTSSGQGEALALRAGLRDPEASGLDRTGFARAYPQEVAQWPYWRRVDLFVDDLLIATVGER